MTALDSTSPVRQLVLMDVIREADQHLVLAKIKEDARAHDGEVNPNRVRDSLILDGELLVDPHVLSATYYALHKTKQIAYVKWIESTDLRSRNRHKPVRLWRWVGAP